MTALIAYFIFGIFISLVSLVSLVISFVFNKKNIEKNREQIIYFKKTNNNFKKLFPYIKVEKFVFLIEMVLITTTQIAIYIDKIILFYIAILSIVILLLLIIDLIIINKNINLYRETSFNFFKINSIYLIITRIINLFFASYMLSVLIIWHILDFSKIRPF